MNEATGDMIAMWMCRIGGLALSLGFGAIFGSAAGILGEEHIVDGGAVLVTGLIFAACLGFTWQCWFRPNG